MSTRLETKFPALSDRIHSAASERIRAAARLVLFRAMAIAGVDSETGSSIIDAVDNQVSLPTAIRARLQSLQESEDDRYLEELDSLESGQELSPAALMSFRRARALAALLESDKPMSATTVCELTYEVLAASADEGAFVEAIADALR